MSVGKGAPWWQGWWRDRVSGAYYNLGKIQANMREDAAKKFTSRFRNLIERSETKTFELVVEHTLEPGSRFERAERIKDKSELFPETLPSEAKQ